VAFSGSPGRMGTIGAVRSSAWTPDTLRAFTEAVGARYGFVHDTTGLVTAAFTVNSLDTTVVVDKTGRIVYRDAAPTSESPCAPPSPRPACHDHIPAPGQPTAHAHWRNHLAMPAHPGIDQASRASRRCRARR